MAALTAAIALGSVVLVAAVPGLVDSGFLGWLEVPMAFRLALHAPLALAFLGACTASLVTFGWVGHLWSRSVRLQYAALAVAAVALAGQFAAWGLIGWGLS